MDNGLIFPYPRKSAHAESSDTNHPKPCEPLVGERGAGWDLDW